MSKAENTTVTLEELLVFQPNRCAAKLFIEKCINTEQEFVAKISEERATYQSMFKPTPHRKEQPQLNYGVLQFNPDQQYSQLGSPPLIALRSSVRNQI